MSLRWLTIILALALAVSLGLNLWLAQLAFPVVDSALVLNDMKRWNESMRETAVDLRWMADRYGRFPDRAAVQAAMDVRFPEPDHVVKWEGDTLWVDEVGLHYTGDSLGSIVLMNEHLYTREVK